MNFQDIGDYFRYDQVLHFDALIRLAIAGVSGVLISLIYKLYHKNEKFDENMMHSMIFISMIICCAMMIIGNNLASAFGLVGAVSIIRFRTAVKSARDMSFVLFSVVIGMACGLGFLFLAIMGMVIIGLVMVIVFYITKDDKNHLLYYKLKISLKNGTSERDFIESKLNGICSILQFESMKLEKDLMSYTYIVALKMDVIPEDIIKTLEGNTKLKDIKISTSIQDMKKK